MFNNTTTFGSGSGAGAVVPIPAVTVPTTVFPGSTITSNSTFIIIGPPPPFPAPPRSIDLSPLKLIFAVIAIIAVPALAYALFFAVPCSSSRRRSNTNSSSSDETPQIIVEPSPPITAERDAVAAANDSGVKFQKETHSKEIGNECTVCLSVFADGEEIRRLSACEHAFHVSCIEMWLKDHPNCPICRADVSVKQTETTVNVNGNVNRGGGNRRVSATSRDDDWRHGLPDESSLV